MARYDEASADYAELANIRGELAMEISAEERQLKEDIDGGAQAIEDSERRSKDELMRAVDGRAISFKPCPHDNERLTDSRIYPSRLLPQKVSFTASGRARSSRA